MNESDLKVIFKKSVKAQGGFACSLGSNLHAGVCDLYINLEGHIPILVEAKFIKSVGPKFKRKINYSEIQKVFLKSVNKAQRGSAYGLVGFRQNGKLFACLISPEHEYIDQDFHKYCAVSEYDPRTRTFDVKSMLACAKATKRKRLNGSVAVTYSA